MTSTAESTEKTTERMERLSVKGNNKKQASPPVVNSRAAALEEAREEWDTCMAQLKGIVSFCQITSLLGKTYAIPWPKFFTTLTRVLSAVNIDVSMFQKPLNDLFGDYVCNFNNMSAWTMFKFHFGPHSRRCPPLSFCGFHP